MKHGKLFFMLTLTLCQTLFTCSTSFSHHTGEHSVTLRLNDRWDECAIVLDPSLTQSDFDAFAGEFSELTYFRPLTGARPLGKFNFDIAIEQRAAKVEDWKPKWNNTFSHIDSSHYLVGDNHVLPILGLRGKMGITDQIDGELYFTYGINSNYGFAGAAVKYAMIDKQNSKWGASVRGSYMTLLGVDDMDFNQISADFLVSRDLWYFSPYIGGALALSHAVETTDKVDLKNETPLSPMAIIGTQFIWKYLSTGIDFTYGKLSIVAIKIGATF